MDIVNTFISFVGPSVVLWYMRFCAEQYYERDIVRHLYSSHD
jgi:hypothetical protein